MLPFSYKSLQDLWSIEYSPPPSDIFLFCLGKILLADDRVEFRLFRSSVLAVKGDSLKQNFSSFSTHEEASSMVAENI